MNITRFKDFKPGAPHPGQQGMCGMPLQRTEYTYIGLANYLPGGGVPDDSPNAKAIERIHYFILEGEMTLDIPGAPITLGKYDSVALDIGDCNLLRNKSNDVAKVLVINGGLNVGPKH